MKFQSETRNSRWYWNLNRRWKKTNVASWLFVIDTWDGTPHPGDASNTATHCNTLQHTATHCNELELLSKTRLPLSRVTSNYASAASICHCSTLQHAATRCNTLELLPETCPPFRETLVTTPAPRASARAASRISTRIPSVVWNDRERERERDWERVCVRVCVGGVFIHMHLRFFHR